MRITKNFNLEEFVDSRIIIASLKPETIINLVLLAIELQKLRDKLNRPIVINSGYRTEAKNRAVGGVPNSQHLSGKAADVRLTNAEQKQLRLSETWNGGYGRGNNYCHLDIGEKRRWEY